MTTPTPGYTVPLNGTADVNDLSSPFYGIPFGGAVRRYFRNYANFTGRASRSEYWWVILFGVLVGLVPGVISAVGSATSGAGNSGLVTFGSFLTVILGLLLVIPTLSLHWRRLHDADLAGPWWFLTFIPVIGSLIVLIFTLLPPKPEGRRFVSKY